MRDGELYLSDSAAGKIRVLATATMKEVRSFAAPSPGPIAVGADGRVWVIQGKPGKEPFDTGGLKIISFSKEGQPGPEITDFENPCALALDPKGRLLVGGLNRHSQVWIYDVSGIPKKVGTFGTEGGIFSGEPGRYEPQKFHWIRGLGFDAAGNLYVAGVFGSWYNALIEAYSPSGQRLWDVYGLGNWLDTACTDPANENVVYTKENVFTMDWSQPPGREQSLAGLTVDRFKYPRDCRVTDRHGPSHRLINGVRRIGGKLFLYCGAQGTGSLEIYKFGEGCVAAPCGYVAGASTWRPENGKRWPEDAETFIWTDGNGDGAPDAAEFASVERKPRWGFMHLDAAAGIWQCSGDGTIFHLPCEGLDPRGNPIYRRASEVSYQYPPEFTGDRLRRLFYIPGDDVMIAGGSPGTEENACNLLICFDHWSDPARRTKRWTINLPLNDKSYTPDTGYGGGAPLAMQACGKYLFVAYGYGLDSRPPVGRRRLRRHDPAGHQRLQRQRRLRRLGQRPERHPPQERRVRPLPGKRRPEPRDDVSLDASPRLRVALFQQRVAALGTMWPGTVRGGSSSTACTSCIWFGAICSSANGCARSCCRTPRSKKSPQLPSTLSIGRPSSTRPSRLWTAWISANTAPSGLHARFDRIRRVAQNVDEFLNFVADMNTLTPELLEESGFARLKQEIRRRVRGI